MTLLKKYGIDVIKHDHATKKWLFSKKTHMMGVVNFNGNAKYEKTTGFNVPQIKFIKMTKHF